MAQGYGRGGGAMGGTRRRTRRRAGRPARGPVTTTANALTRTATANPVGRIQAQMQRASNTTNVVNRRRAAALTNQRAQRQRQNNQGGKPGHIPAGFNNRIVKKLPGGSHEIFYCQGSTLTPDCMKAANKLSEGRNMIAPVANIRGKRGVGGSQRSSRLTRGSVVKK